MMHFYFQHATVDSMDLVASLFANVIKTTPCHVTLLMEDATVTRGGLGKNALYVSTLEKYLSLSECRSEITVFKNILQAQCKSLWLSRHAIF